MHLFVKSISGRVIKVDINDTDTIIDIKEAIQSIDGISPAQQRLMFNGMMLRDTQTLSEVAIADGNTIHMVLNLRAG